MNQEETKKMEIMGKAEKLQDFIFRITSKRPKKDENGIDIENAGKNNGLPAKYQNSIGVRLQNYSLDMIEILDDIQYDKANRLELLSGLLGVLRHINSCFWLCFRLNIISKQSAEAGEKLLLDVKYMALSWRKKLSQE